ncbi:hypothetical protein [Bacillus paranthracis]|uniref:hypothetical protein n=1 Tax=Bacillus paranthracis TaxID=2026186 RepID=UPI0039A1847B
MKHDDLKKRLVEFIENKDVAASTELKEGLEEVFSLAETAEKQKDIIKKFQHAQDIVIPHQLDEMKKIIKTYKNALEHVNLELKEIERSLIIFDHVYYHNFSLKFTFSKAEQTSTNANALS